jgi:hypothetical protein
MLNALLDQSSTAAPPRPKKRRAQAAPQHDPETVLLDGLINSCFSTAQVLFDRTFGAEDANPAFASG